MSRNRFKVGKPQRSRLVFEQLEGKRMLTSVPTSLTFITANQSVVAGANSGTVKVELLDQTGHAMNATSPIVVTLTKPAGANETFLSFPGNTPITSVTIAKGASTASFEFVDTTAGADTITASSGVLHSALQTETIVAGAATQIVIAPPTVQPIIAGIATPISIKLEDQYGNLALAAASSHIVTVTKTPHGPTYTVTTGTTTGQELALFSTSSTAQFFASASSTTPITSVVIPKGSTGVTIYYKDVTPGVATVSVDGAGLGSTMETETVTEGASQIVFSSAAETTTAGVKSTPITVELKAADGTIAFATSTTTVSLSSTSSTGLFYNSTGTGSPLTSVTIAVGQSTASFTYEDTTAGMPTLTATSPPLASGSQTETVVPAAVSQLILSPGSATFQTNQTSPTIIVTEEDQFGNLVLAPAGGQNIKLKSTSPTGIFEDANGQTVTTVKIPQGSATTAFTYSDPTAGMYTLTITATGLGVSATMPVTVTPVQATQIAITPPATNTTPAGVQSGPFTVTLEDASGNPIVATHNITINLNSSSAATGEFFDSTNTQTTTITILAGNSAATFTYLDTMAGTPTLTATDITDGFTSVSTTTTITASAAPAQVVFVTPSPQSVAAGTPLTVTVELEDASGNPVPATSTTTVTLSDNGGGGTFNPTSLTFNVGVTAQSFTYTNNTVGTYTLSLTSAGLTSPSNLTVNVGSTNPSATVVNNSFESPTAMGQTILTGPNNGWIYAGSSSAGVTTASAPGPQSTFFNAAPPDGNQAAFMFAGSTISQIINFPAGTYSLSFFMISPTNLFGNAAISVLVDGNQVLAPTLPGSTLAWNQFTTSSFTLSAGNHTIEFLASGGSETSASIDLVTLS